MSTNNRVNFIVRRYLTSWSEASLHRRISIRGIAEFNHIASMYKDCRENKTVTRKEKGDLKYWNHRATTFKS